MLLVAREVSDYVYESFSININFNLSEIINDFDLIKFCTRYTRARQCEVFREQILTQEHRIGLNYNAIDILFSEYIF